MTNRPRSHVQEEESRRAFRDAIAPEWVVRDYSPDYGLDVQVDIFEEAHATSYFFCAQIKSRENLDAHSPSHRFETERLNHYLACRFPVMLVVYDTKTRRLYYRWVRQTFGALDKEGAAKWKRQDTVEIRFSDPEDRLDGKRSEALATEVKRQTWKMGARPDTSSPFTLLISSTTLKAPADQAQLLLSRGLSYSADIRFVRPTLSGAADATILIEEAPNRLQIKCGGASTSVEQFEFASDLQDLVDGLFFLTAWALAESGYENLALDMVLAGVSTSIGPIGLRALLGPWVPSLFSKLNRNTDCMAVAERVAAQGHILEAQLLSIQALGEGGSGCPEAYRRFLHTALLASSDARTTAALHYNLANSFRCSGMVKPAVEHYVKAIRGEPAYRERPYWWAELGGCLFELGKPLWATKCYSQSLQLRPDAVPVRARLADALLHAGKAKEAANVFDQYFGQGSPGPSSSAWVLRRWLASKLAIRNPVFRRDQIAALKLTQQAISLPAPEARRLLKEAIDNDPLCGLAWFNYAATSSQADTTDGLIPWLVTAILQEWDVEAWGNAIAIMLGPSIEVDAVLLAAALHSGFRRHGTALEVQLTRVLPKADPRVFQVMAVKMEQVNDPFDFTKGGEPP